MTNRAAPFKRVKIGIVSDEARKLGECKFGFSVEYINIDKNGVIHAMGEIAHNLEAYDLLYAVDVINTSKNIIISPKKHKSSNVLIFKKDINGEITFLAEVHEKNKYLSVFNAWGQKRARRGATANADNTGMPSTNVLNDSPYADNSLSPESYKKSSGRSETSKKQAKRGVL